jgi:hypothetical protein
MYTLGGAAKATGMTKSAISKAIAKGRITAKKDELGRFEIDPAELHRIYAPLPSPEKSERERTQEITAENRELKARLEVIGQLLADIKEDRDHWRRQATALLTSSQQQEAKPAPRSWWLWWLPV